MDPDLCDGNTIPRVKLMKLETVETDIFDISKKCTSVSYNR